jgi:hypothetical protein
MKNITANEIDEFRKITGKSLKESLIILKEYKGDIKDYLKSNSIIENKVLPDKCPHCKNPNTKLVRECEWCGNQII